MSEPIQTIDIESESRVVATALLSPANLAQLEREIPPPLFAHEPARRVYKLALRMRERGDPIALDNVTAALAHELDGQQYCECFKVVTAALVPEQFEHHLGRLKESLGRRVAVEMAQRLIEAAGNTGRDDWRELARSIGEHGAQGPRKITESATIDLASFAGISPRDAASILPHPAWKGIQREGTLAIIAGPSKAKKSWFILAKLQHAILGKPFLGREMLPPSTGKPRKAILLDFELPKSVLMSRYIALSGEFEDEERKILFDRERVSIEAHRGNMSVSVDWVSYCCGRILEFCGAGDVAAVDCLQPVMGDLDANLAQVVRPVIAKFQAVADSCGAVAEIVDHFNKSGEGGGMNRISGSMAKAAGPDTILTLNSDPNGIRIETDLRMDPPIEPFHVQFEPFEFKVVTEEQIEQRKQDIKAEKGAKLLHEMFPDRQWHSVKELAERLGMSKQGVKSRLEKFEDVLEMRKEGTSHLYRLGNKGNSEQ